MTIYGGGIITKIFRRREEYMVTYHKKAFRIVMTLIIAVLMTAAIVIEIIVPLIDRTFETIGT